MVSSLVGVCACPSCAGKLLLLSMAFNPGASSSLPKGHLDSSDWVRAFVTGAQSAPRVLEHLCTLVGLDDQSLQLDCWLPADRQELPYIWSAPGVCLSRLSVNACSSECRHKGSAGGFHLWGGSSRSWDVISCTIKSLGRMLRIWPLDFTFRKVCQRIICMGGHFGTYE
jgi:hypothetical protein